MPDEIFRNKAILLQIKTRGLNLGLIWSNAYW